MFLHLLMRNLHPVKYNDQIVPQIWPPVLITARNKIGALGA